MVNPFLSVFVLNFHESLHHVDALSCDWLSHRRWDGIDAGDQVAYPLLVPSSNLAHHEEAFPLSPCKNARYFGGGSVPQIMEGSKDDISVQRSEAILLKRILAPGLSFEMFHVAP